MSETSKPSTADGNDDFWNRLDPDTRAAALALVRAWGMLQRWMEPHFRSLGVSQPQFAVLMTLRRSDPDGISLTELARSAFVSNANMTGLADRLGKLGLVRRRRDPNDRRSQLVRLTDKGGAVLDRAWERHPEMFETAFAGLSAAEKRRAAGLLLKFTRTLGARIAGDGSAPTSNRRRIRKTKRSGP